MLGKTMRAAIAAIVAAIVVGCARQTPTPVFPVDPVERNLPAQAARLAGLKICIDPGHGGDIGPKYEETGYKRGPTGFREAVANLRVALKLAELLRAAGATPILTRVDDSEVDLDERVRISNDSDADIFLSIHHNGSTRETANFASIWYHGDGSLKPASLDLARAISASLIRTIQPSEPQYSGIYSDRLMYETGFRVLRATDAPGVLAECSFFSNRAEERRLADPTYNDLTAWAIFVGLCEWADYGIPRVEFVGRDEEAARFRLADGMKEVWGGGAPRLRPDSVRATLDGEPIDFTLDGDALRIPIPADYRTGSLAIAFENRAKNSSITPPFALSALAIPELTHEGEVGVSAPQAEPVESVDASP